MLVVIFVGLAMVVCATIAMPWPSDTPGEPYARLVRHWERLLGTPEEGFIGADISWSLRRVQDALHYVLILAGLGLATWVSFSDRAMPWVGLAVVGVVGVLYTLGLALYNGPLVAMPGYLFILIGAVFTLLMGKRGSRDEME